jgi:hypothetical protein
MLKSRKKCVVTIASDTGFKLFSQALEEMISVLNRRLDAGEGRERVLKSRVDLLQGRLVQVGGVCRVTR